MDGGRGGGLDATLLTGFTSFSWEREELLFQTKFLAVASFLGHLSMEKVFQIGPAVLALKLDKGRVLGGERGLQPPLHGLLFTYFSDHEDDIQFQQIFCMK